METHEITRHLDGARQAMDRGEVGDALAQLRTLREGVGQHDVLDAVIAQLEGAPFDDRGREVATSALQELADEFSHGGVDHAAVDKDPLFSVDDLSLSLGEFTDSSWMSISENSEGIDDVLDGLDDLSDFDDLDVPDPLEAPKSPEAEGEDDFELDLELDLDLDQDDSPSLQGAAVQESEGLDLGFGEPSGERALEAFDDLSQFDLDEPSGAGRGEMFAAFQRPDAPANDAPSSSELSFDLDQVGDVASFSGSDDLDMDVDLDLDDLDDLPELDPSDEGGEDFDLDLDLGVDDDLPEMDFEDDRVSDFDLDLGLDEFSDPLESSDEPMLSFESEEDFASPGQESDSGLNDLEPPERLALGEESSGATMIGAPLQELSAGPDLFASLPKNDGDSPDETGDFAFQLAFDQGSDDPEPLAKGDDALSLDDFDDLDDLDPLDGAGADDANDDFELDLDLGLDLDLDSGDEPPPLAEDEELVPPATFESGDSGDDLGLDLDFGFDDEGEEVAAPPQQEEELVPPATFETSDSGADLDFGFDDDDAPQEGLSPPATFETGSSGPSLSFELDDEEDELEPPATFGAPKTEGASLEFSFGEDDLEPPATFAPPDKVEPEFLVDFDLGDDDSPAPQERDAERTAGPFFQGAPKGTAYNRETRANPALSPESRSNPDIIVGQKFDEDVDMSDDDWLLPDDMQTRMGEEVSSDFRDGHGAEPTRLAPRGDFAPTREHPAVSPGDSGLNFSTAAAGETAQGEALERSAMSQTRENDSLKSQSNPATVERSYSDADEAGFDAGTLSADDADDGFDFDLGFTNPEEPEEDKSKRDVSSTRPRHDVYQRQRESTPVATQAQPRSRLNTPLAPLDPSPGPGPVSGTMYGMPTDFKRPGASPKETSEHEIPEDEFFALAESIAAEQSQASVDKDPKRPQYRGEPMMTQGMGTPVEITRDALDRSFAERDKSGPSPKPVPSPFERARKANPFVNESPTGVRQKPLSDTGNSSFVLEEIESEPELEAIEPPAPAESGFELASRLYHDGQPAEAKEALRGFLTEHPNDADAKRLRVSIDGELERVHLATLGSLERTPVLNVSLNQLTSLNLDNRSGFLISQIDGLSTFQDILDLSGMSRAETMEVLAGLLDKDVITAS